MVFFFSSIVWNTLDENNAHYSGMVDKNFIKWEIQYEEHVIRTLP